MTQVSLFAIVRPFLWIGAFAFVIGFAGYLFLSGPSDAAYAQEAPAALQASAPTPPSASLRAA